MVATALGWAAVVVIVAGAAYLRARRARRIIERWATDRRLTIRSLSYKWFSLDRFVWASRKLVYEAVVDDELGQRRAVLVRVFGLSKSVRLKWKDP